MAHAQACSHRNDYFTARRCYRVSVYSSQLIYFVRHYIYLQKEQVRSFFTFSQHASVLPLLSLLRLWAIGKTVVGIGRVPP